MKADEDLIRGILDSSQVPSLKRRQEIARELHAHLQDFILVAREAGRSEDEIQILLRENFGSPREIAKEFAAVYASERAIMRASVFLLATLTVAALISAVVLAVQAGVASSLGVPVAQVFAVRHLSLETLFILFTAAAYVGLLTLEKFYSSRAFEKAFSTLAAMFLIGAFVIPPEIIGAAFVGGTLLRAMQLFFRSKAARLSAALIFFGFFGLMSACRQSPGLANQATLQVIVWLAIGACGHWMTSLSARLDRALLSGLKQT